MTPVPLQSWEPGAAPETVTAALFDGVILAFRTVPAVVRLGDRVRAIVATALGPDDPCGAEARMAPDAFRAVAARLRQQVADDAETQACWRAALAEIGFRPDEILGDRIRLRIVPSQEAARGRRTRPLPPHRDSWGSGLMAQVNWWLPLYPLTPTRTMLVWPEAFRRAVANGSAAWDFTALQRDRTGRYPILPAAEEPIAAPGRPVLAEPDTLIAFSAAHLHASAADGSGRSRISLDTRTLWQPDLAAGRGAPNVDAPAVTPQLAWFAPLALFQPPTTEILRETQT